MVDAGAVATRQHAKLGLLGAMYGATSGESGRMVAGLTRRYPQAFGSSRRQRVPASGDRWSAPSSGAAARPSADPGRVPGRAARRPRRARSQAPLLRPVHPQLRGAGHGAEWALCRIADLRNRLWRLGDEGPLERRPHLAFFLHDEVVVHAPAGLADAVAAAVTEAASTAGRLLFRELAIDFPLTVSVVRSYADAGKPGDVGRDVRWPAFSFRPIVTG